MGVKFLIEVTEMIYISKGIVLERSTEELLFIRRCGTDFQLTGAEAALWLNGRTGFSEAVPSIAARHLSRMGLIEWENEDTPLSRYRILTRCICCPADTPELFPLRWQKAHLMTWLRKAGLWLTVAELVYLAEHRITPSAKLLGVENRQELVSLIYTRDNIQDNILENQMEKARCRDSVVESLLALLKRKRLVLI
jgi:hypothetical protein